MAQLLSWGEILWDCFPDGRQLGGAPANVAYHLAALGEPTCLVSRVGDDEPGRAAIARLAEAGVDTSLIQVDRSRPTGAVIVEVDGAGNASYRLNRGGAWEWIALTDDVRSRLAEARALAYGTFCQRNPDAIDALMTALAEAPADCLKVCDPNLRKTGIDDQILERSLAAADVVKINHREAAAIEERLGASDAIGWLRDRGVRWVALTRGEAGSLLVGPDGEHDCPGYPAAGGDTVGAGDGYTAVLIKLLLAGAPVDRINDAANRYGAFVASQRGATPAIPEHIVRQVGK